MKGGRGKSTLGRRERGVGARLRQAQIIIGACGTEGLQIVCVCVCVERERERERGREGERER